MGTDLLEMFGIEEKAESPPPKPKPKADTKTDAPARSMNDAAKAVADAVRTDTGRAKKVDNWKPVAADVLGLKRLHPKRWDAVIKAGIDAGLFKVDDSGKHPVLITLDSEPEEEEEEEIVGNPARTIPLPPPPPPIDPKDWRPPYVLDCGHMSFSTDEEEALAREEGHCCANHKGQVHWQYLKGDYRRPVPKSGRRTKEKAASGTGYPGLCCDDKGFYQGGLANCALYKDPQATPCEGCALRRRKGKLFTDEEEA